jgi:hypothetical protein
MAMCAKDIAGKLLSCFFVIMLFVICGFEHCIANMYYITAGLFAMENPLYVDVFLSTYNYSADALNSLNIKDKKTVVMIGDRKYDVIGAHDNNIDCIAAIYGGYSSEDEFVEEINLEIENVVDSKVDASSDIYNSQFPDFFNYPREYTQFIDVVTINEGSRLTYISLKQYGHKDFWVYIYEANRDVIANPNSIKVGVKLRIPKLAPELIDANNQQCIDYARYLHDIYVNE